jgi:hypothetical protein
VRTLQLFKRPIPGTIPHLTYVFWTRPTKSTRTNCNDEYLLPNPKELLDGDILC